MQNHIIQYVFDSKNRKRGVVLATKIRDNVCLGWSYTNIKAGDKFDKKLGLKIAWGRANSGSSATMPREVWSVAEKMATRAEKYFKLDEDNINKKDFGHLG